MVRSLLRICGSSQISRCISRRSRARWIARAHYRKLNPG
jgi:hypothetical protein